MSMALVAISWPQKRINEIQSSPVTFSIVGLSNFINEHYTEKYRDVFSCCYGYVVKRDGNDIRGIFWTSVQLPKTTPHPVYCTLSDNSSSNFGLNERIVLDTFPAFQKCMICLFF